MIKLRQLFEETEIEQQYCVIAGINTPWTGYSDVNRLKDYWHEFDCYKVINIEALNDGCILIRVKEIEEDI